MLEGTTGAASLLTFTADSRYLVSGQTWYVANIRQTSPGLSGIHLDTMGRNAIAFIWDLERGSFVEALADQQLHD